MDMTMPWPPALAFAAIGLLILFIAVFLHLRQFHKLQARVDALERWPLVTALSKSSDTPDQTPKS